MMKSNTETRLPTWLSRPNPLFCCFLIMICLEAWLMVRGASAYYYEHKNYSFIPVLLFLGAASMTKLTPSAKRKLLLGILCTCWFLAVQKHRFHMGWSLHPYGWFFATYLMAYPFAAITQDGEKSRGLKVYLSLFPIISLVLVFYGILLLLDQVPSSMAEDLYYFSAGRVNLIWNANISGCIFYIALILCFLGFLRSKSKWVRGVLLAAGAAIFYFLALTNAKTSILILCLVLGAIVMLHFFPGKPRRVAIGILTAVLLAAAIVFSSSRLYAMHTQSLLEKYAQKAEAAQETEPIQETEPTVRGFLAEISPEKELSDAVSGVAASIGSPSGRFAALRLSSTEEPDYARMKRYLERQLAVRSDSKFQLGSLGSRTDVWRGALRVMRDDPYARIWGVEDVGEAISQYTELEFAHAHNSWAQITLSLGIPGAVISVIYTWIALWNCAVLLFNRTVSLGKKGIVLLTLGILLTGFMEPFLFYSNVYYHFIDFAFFLCLGYIRVWVEQLPRKFDTGKFPFCLL